MEMRNKNNNIESRSKELQQMHIRKAEIKERINAIATTAFSPYSRFTFHRLDWDGNKVQLGDKVLFLTKGRYKSTGGLVKILSRPQNHFFAIIDEFGNVIQQKLCNIRVVEEN